MDHCQIRITVTPPLCQTFAEQSPKNIESKILEIKLSHNYIICVWRQWAALFPRTLSSLFPLPSVLTHHPCWWRGGVSCSSTENYLSPKCDSCHFQPDQSTKTLPTKRLKQGQKIAKYYPQNWNVRVTFIIIKILHFLDKKPPWLNRFPWNFLPALLVTVLTWVSVNKAIYDVGNQ